MKKITSVLLAAILILAVAGCSEGGTNPSQSEKIAEVTTIADSVKEKPIESEKEIATKTPIETVKTIETEKNLIDSELMGKYIELYNQELVDELGMTFGELEKKYGKAEKGRVGELNESNNHGFYIYSFKGSNIDYSFYAESDGQKTISDGTPRVKEDEIFFRFEGAAKEFFLNFEKPMTYEEFSKIYGILWLGPPDDWEWDDWGTGMYINDKTHIWMDYEKDGIIKPDSPIRIMYELG